MLRRLQPVDATHSLNLSAGDWKSVLERKLILRSRDAAAHIEVLGNLHEKGGKDGKAIEKLMQITGGRGVDTAIEAVGVPASFLLCQDIVSPGGVIANIGVHGTKYPRRRRTRLSWHCWNERIW